MGDRALVLAILVPPVAWALQLLLLVLMARPHCAGSRVAFYAVTLVAALLALASAVTGKRARASDEERRRWMAELAMACGAFYVLVILAQAVPAVLVNTCE